MEQDNFHRIDNDSVENQVTTSSKQELCTQVNEQFDKIAKRAKWGLVLGMAVITINLWLSISGTFEPYQGYKLILISVLGLMMMIKSVADLLKVEKLKKFSSRKQQLKGVLRSRKYQLMSRWLLVIFIFLYILIDVIHDWSLGTLIFGTLFLLIFSFVFFSIYEKTPSYERSEKLEGDLRQLIEMEK